MLRSAPDFLPDEPMLPPFPTPEALRPTLEGEVRAAYDTALAVAERVAAAGGRTLLVGGCVRDALLGMPVKDFDLEVYGLEPDALRALCAEIGAVDDVGASYGVLIVSRPEHASTRVDVGLPRRDSKVRPGHRGFDVDTDPRMPIEEAVRRRDFTMNALLADPFTGEILDPTDGRADLEAGVLRVVDPRTFGDDPLRVLRGLQFLARFDLALDPASEDVLRASIPALRELAPERLEKEWRKLLLLSERPSVGLRAGRALGVFAALHPELDALWETPQEPQWHPEGDVGTHTCMVADEAAAIVRREGLGEADAWAVMLGALCHDLGKPSTTEVLEGRIRSLEHSMEGLAPTATFLETINADHDTRVKVAALVRDHLAPGQFWRSEERGEPVSDGAIRRLADRLHPATIGLLACVAEADARGRGPFPAGSQEECEAAEVPERSWLLARAEALAVRDAAPADILQGRDLLTLGLRPGSAFGAIIRRANDLRDDLGRTREDVLALLDGASDEADALRRLEDAAR